MNGVILGERWTPLLIVAGAVAGLAFAWYAGGTPVSYVVAPIGAGLLAPMAAEFAIGIAAGISQWVLAMVERVR